MKTVGDLFDALMGSLFVSGDEADHLMSSLNECPLDSHCGEVCRAAILKGRDLMRELNADPKKTDHFVHLAVLYHCSTIIDG